ncbi:MAG: hypothetical protein LBT74_10140 [Acidobacteriota bacterium]|jgi:hypothetical protein|nr:hypothetical protein [Acidobacteriota bacterium]
MARVLVILAVLLGGAASMRAEDACTRQMLVAAADSYIAAQKAGDLSKVRLAEKVAYTEDMSETTKDKGIWNTALPIAHHLSIYDVARCKTFTEIIVTEGHQYVLGVRLKVAKDGRVSGIDSMVTDKDDWLFNADDYLKYSKAEDWSVLPVDDRVTRQDLIDAGNQYFDFVFLDKFVRAPWGTPCARLEGGAYTNPEGNDKDNCQIPAPLGEMFMVNRSYVVDEEMGTVNVWCRFANENGMPDSHLFRLVKGRYRYIHTLSVNLTGQPVVVPEYKPED